MKAIISLVAITLGFAGSAFAGHHGDHANAPARARVAAYNMSCSAVQNAVARAGAAIVYEAPDIYDRYVVSGAYCPTGSSAEAGWVRTADSNACLLWKCRQSTGEGSGE